VEEGAPRGGGTSPAVSPGKLTALLQELAASPREQGAGAWEVALRAGAIVGRFELVRELGHGGFGVVWEARDRELGRSVAFKAVPPGRRAAAREERLLLEAEAAARLSHPNIVTLYDVGRAEQGPYLVLELLEGETLEERLARGPLSVAEALRVCTEVVKGVAHAHAKGVVHRDLKPANVFLCAGGQVKVLDFGLAHAFGQRPAGGGTRGYMAPEQAEGAPEDERTDVFALGAILYRMLTGELPYGEGGAERRPPAELEVAEVPALCAFLSRMLSPRPTERPRDAGEVLAALSGFRSELDTGGANTASVKKRRRRRRVVAWAALGVVACGAVAGAAVWWSEHRRGSSETKPSLAVLPFADLSPQHDQEYFADGVTEEILNALAKVDGLRVPGRTSSFFFRGKSVELGEIGRRLNVEHVLEGSVRRAGDRIRITAKVVNVSNGYQLWSDTFDGSFTQLFDVQDQFAKAVVRELQVKLLRGAARTPARPRSEEAYAQFTMGRNLFYTGYLENVERSARHFERAAALDPEYAPAWAFLSIAITQVAVYTGRTDPEAQRRALAAAEKAIALAPDDAIGYVARTFLRNLVLWDWDGALADAERALKLEKNYVAPYNQYAMVLDNLGRVREAIAAARTATDGDPLNAVYWSNLGVFHLDAGELDAARTAFERAMELSPERYRFSLGLVELLAGSPRTALEAFERHPLEERRLQGVAMAQHDLGRRAESDRALEQLVARHGETAPYMVAAALAWLGERDQAFAWLDRAFARRDPQLSSIKGDPLVRNLHGDPRYTAMLRKMNLPVN
jgi:TolB-like protein/tetratricopeptide (TPR) repeat protein